MDTTRIMPAAAAFGGLYALANLYALLVSDRLLFAPQVPSYDRLDNEVRIPTEDGEELTGVFLEGQPERPTLLFSHGNAEDLGNVVPFIRQFHALGCSVLMYDYRGYGTSSGSPSYRGVCRDALAAYRWLREEPQIDPQQIVSHGRSLGGAVAVWLAARRTVGGLIMESTFASAFRVKTHWRLLLWDKFNSLADVRRAHCPLLILHGTADEIIPWHHGKRLYRAAAQPKEAFWIEGGHHNDYAYVAGDQYLQRIDAFLRRLPQLPDAITPK